MLLLLLLLSLRYLCVTMDDRAKNTSPSSFAARWSCRRDGGKASLPPPLPLLKRRARFPDDSGRQDNRRRRIAYLCAAQYDIGTRFFSRYGRRRAEIVDGFVSSFLIDVQPNSAPGLWLWSPLPPPQIKKIKFTEYFDCILFAQRHNIIVIPKIVAWNCGREVTPTNFW